MNIKPEVFNQDTEAETVDYLNEDIIRLPEDPSNLSTDEKAWLTNEYCETHEDVLAKCRELLKGGD